MSAADTLRRQVRDAVLASGCTQKSIAQQLGTSEKHLSRMLTGRAPLTLTWAERVTDLTGDTLHVAVGTSDAATEFTLAAGEALGKAQAEAELLRRTLAVIRSYADTTLHAGPPKVDACEVREKLLWLTAVDKDTDT